jgi:hypothetical protein
MASSFIVPNTRVSFRVRSLLQANVEAAQGEP